AVEQLAVVLPPIGQRHNGGQQHAYRVAAAPLRHWQRQPPQRLNAGFDAGGAALQLPGQRLGIERSAGAGVAIMGLAQ
nr:hypothetical protein [Tanacetum cinerariifolium]